MIATGALSLLYGIDKNLEVSSIKLTQTDTYH